jgi:prepilin-type N-terminal cleavage/methylation domain-containing protein
MMHAGRKAGFTMIELLVVLAIVAVVIGISVPTIASLSSPKRKLRKDARGLMQLLTEARSVAMNRKISVDVWIDPTRREVRAVESEIYRALRQADPYGTQEIDDEDRMLAMTNRFERIEVFEEGTLLEAFTAEEIEVETDEEEDIFQRLEKPEPDFQSLEKPEGEVLALTFNHFGGSTGGGISLIRDDVRLDLACDILTGRPEIVKRITDE